MSRLTRPVRVFSALLAAVLLGGLWLARPYASQADGESFRAAWDQARRAGSYRFNADVQQTLTPRPLPEMIGQQDQRVGLLVQGDVQQPGRARLQLQLSQGVASIPPITLIQQGDQSFVQKGDTLELVQNPVGVVAPTADFMSYLAAADNVRRVDGGPLPQSGSSEVFTRYTFDVNGTRFADYLREQLQERVQREVGATVTIAVPDQLTRLSGHGELWVDSRGFPRRQALTLAIPQTTDLYDARAVMVVDFRDFGQVTAVPQPVQGADGSWRLSEPLVAQGSEGDVSSSLVWRMAHSVFPLSSFLFPLSSCLLLLGLGVFMVAVVRVRRRRRAVYAAVVGVTIVSLVVGPLLQASRLIDFSTRQAQAASAKPMTDALGLGAAGDQGNLWPAPAGLLAPQTSGAAAQRIAACGEGSDIVDSDNDGLTDRVENCLGADPFNADTDGDGLKDGVEVAGFSHNGQTWYSDPLRVDSNGDGRSDVEEWPQSLGGQSPVIDTDGDGIPDLWDMDDDGDGVDDSLDLSPTAKSASLDSFNLQTQNPNFDGAQYIEIQVRPETADHLRYGAGRFDWPRDAEGTITDLDDSTDDMRLIPVLQVDTNVAPDTNFAQKYGVSVLREGTTTRLIVPLAVTSANTTTGGGLTQYDHVQALYAKVGYGPAQQADIQWTNAKLLWMVQATLDRYVNCANPDSPDATTCRVESGSNVVQTYADRFQVSGLRITKSRAFEVGIFGTPQFPTEDQQLFQFNLALAGLFMSKDRLATQPAGETFLQEVERRFTNPNTPLDLRWGLPPSTAVAVSRSVYTHHDEGQAGVSAAATSFLNTNYPDSAYALGRCGDSTGAQFKCATLALAFEEQLGVAGLDDLAAVGTAGFFSNLGQVPLTTTRGWRMMGYESAGGQWQAMSPARTIDVMNRRYSGSNLQATLTEAQQTHPLLTLSDMRYLTYLAYASALTGASKAVQVGDLKLLLDQQLEDQIVGIVKLQAAKTPNYFGGVLGADDYLENLRQQQRAFNSIREVDEELTVVQGEQAAYMRSQTYWARTGQVAGVVGVLLLAGSIILQAVQRACLDRNAPPGTEPRDTCNLDQRAIKVASITIGALQQATAAVTLIVTIKGFTQAGAQAGAQAGGLLAAFKAAGSAAKAAAVVGFLVQIGVIWATFGLAVAGGASPGSIAFNMALATAIVSTIVAIIFLVLAFVPGINIIVALIGLIDGIVSLATNGQFSITGFLIETIVKVFYDVSILASIKSVESDGGTTSLSGAVSGLVKGATFSYTDTYRTTFTGSRLGQSDTNAWMEFRGSVPDGGATVGAAPVNQGDFHCEVQAEPVYAPSPFGQMAISASVCTNNAGVSFLLNTARPNVALKVEALLHYSIPYKECSLGICGSVKRERGVSDPSSFTLYLDVLPSSLDNFWAFTPTTTNPRHKFNLDQDGDGLPDTLEDTLGTAKTLWDTDGDGLSDGFEYYSRDTLGTDPLKADGDKDGLSDAEELRYGTNPRVADTDGDGLLDGQEVCRVQVQNGAPVQLGGWTAQVFGASRPTARVCSDPLVADSDGDGLSDQVEKEQGLSPYARNDAPQLTITGRPMSNGPDGQRGIYVKRNEVITPTLELLSSGAFPVTQTLQVCLPGVLTGVTAGTLQGVPPLPTRIGPTAGCDGAGGQGFAWPFTSSAKLDLTRLVRATFSSQAVAATSSTSGTLQASVVYGGRTLTDRVPVVVDADNPTVRITSPANGAVLRGGSFVVGGVADDPTSWLSGVSVQVNSGAYQAATGLRTWAWTWSNPPDGAYTLTAQATDYVGNPGSHTVNVTVDNTPPTVTLNPPGAVTLGGVVYVTPGPGGATIALAGKANDTLSGVAQVQISLDRQPWRDVSLSGTDWTFNWEVTGDAQGSHRVTVRAFDGAGNESAPATRTVIVDAVPPTDELTSPDLATFDATGYPLEVKAGAPLTLYGRANDAGRVPLPSRPVSLTGPDPVNSVAQATVWLQPPSPNDYDGGVNAVWLGDMNGDGRGDLAVGLPGANGGAGGVYVVQGRGGAWPILPDAEALADAALVYSGAAGAGLGGIVASAGDVDGDGRYDLLVGDPANGRVFLVFGRASHVSRNIALTEPRSGDWQVLTLPPGATLRQVAAAGDVNGDGFGDILVRTTDTLYLLLGHSGVWDPTLAVTAEAAARMTVGAAAQATGVGDADGVQVGGKSFGDFVVTDPANSLGGGAAVYLFSGGIGFTRRGGRVLSAATDAVKFTGAGTVGDKIAPLGNVTGGPFADFIFSTGSGPKLVYKDGGGAWAELVFSGYTPAATGLLAGVGDVDRDGRNDLLIGNAAGDAYLFHGAASLTPGVSPVVTLTDVAAAASAPYAAGADLNCDASSDLLLVPGDAVIAAKTNASPRTNLPRTELAFGQTGVAPNRLPVGTADGGRQTADGGRWGKDQAGEGVEGADKAAGVQTLNPATLYVDDDYCAACANDGRVWGIDAFATVQAAVDAADQGDTIVVNPGVYTGFNIIGVTKSSLKILGVNPDAVFVNGAVTIQDATGVRLSKLTLRNAPTLLTLTRAGSGGAGNPPYKTRLDNSVLYGYTDHAVSMDRLSSLGMTRTTIAGEPGNGAYVDIRGPIDPYYDRVWSGAITNMPGTMSAGGAMAATGSDLYVLRGGSQRGLLRGQMPLLGAWTQVGTLPVRPGGQSELAEADAGAVYVLHTPSNLTVTVSDFIQPCFFCFIPEAGIHALVVDGQGNVYVGGNFRQLNGIMVNHIAKWTASTQTWSALHGGLNGAVTGMALDNTGKLWVVGDFDTNAAGNQTLNHVAYSDGNGWVATGAGVNAQPQDIKVEAGGSILIGGWFTQRGGQPAAVQPTGYAGDSGDFLCQGGPGTITLANPSQNKCQVFPVGTYDEINHVAFYPNFPNDTATEVKVGGLVKVTLCGNTFQGGPCTTFNPNADGSAQSLGSLAGQVSSLKVELQSPAIPYQIARWNGGPEWVGIGPGVTDDGTGFVMAVDNDGTYTYAGGALPVYDPPALDGYNGTTCDAAPNQVVLFENAYYNWGDASSGAGDRVCLVYTVTPNITDLIVLPASIAAKVSSVQVGGLVSLGMYERNDGVTVSTGFISLDHDVADLSLLRFNFGGSTNIVNDNVRSIQVSWRVPSNVEQNLMRTWNQFTPGSNGPAEQWGSAGNVDNTVFALKTYNSTLYAGGAFTSINGDPGLGNHFARQQNTVWQATAGVNGDVYSLAVTPGGNIVAGGDFTAPGNRVAQYNVASNTWTALGGGVSSRARALAFDADGLLLVGSGSVVNRWFPTQQAFDLSNLFYRFAGTTFTPKASLPGAVGAGLALASDAAGNAWALAGGGTSTYRYSSATNAWTAGGALMTPVGAGGAVAYAGTYGLYALVGGGSAKFFRSTDSGATWSALSDAPFSPGDGAALVWDGRDYLYATQAGNGLGFMRYSLVENVWETLGDNSAGTTTDDSTPEQVGAGGGLARIGDFLYALIGNNSAGFYQYGRVGLARPEKLTLDRVAFVQPGAVSSSQWLSLTQETEDFGVGRTGLAWTGDGSWSPLQTVKPGSFASTVSLAAARFVDQVRHVFRLQAASALTAGYADALGDAFVSSAYCATCANDGLTWGQTAFSSVQAAIDRGAPRVNLRPGLYREPFYLTSGVQVNGSGPDLTLIQPPAGTSPAYLVGAEGIVGASLNRLSLVGAGLRVEDGALSVRLSRAIIRGAATAIRQDGAATELEVVNNTLVGNSDGLTATGCAAVDVRNTIFASHSGVALRVQGAGSSCTPTPVQLERYNLFWLNGGDVQVDGGTPQAASGLGDVTLDPYFTAPNQMDYRPRVGSPTADAGNPTDPSPPGSNGRVDIGAFEVGQAAFYADDNYCDPVTNSACVNDGLTWGVDAFSQIQHAVNAAQIASAAVNTASSFTTFTVGVGPGVYTERVAVPSYIHLVGSGAERTTINGGGTGDVVTLAGAVQAEVRGFTITGSGTGATDAGIRVAGASNTVSLSRNILRGNRVGILFTGGATGEAQFNTIVSNSGAGVRSEGANTWVTVSNSILAGNNPGLEAAAPAQLFHAYNLLYNTPNADFGGGLTAGSTEIVSQNPNLASGDYHLNTGSPAVDAADPGVQPPVGGGTRADLGYRERLAVPLTLLFGKEGVSCVVGNSGMGTVDIGLVNLPTASWSSGVTTTLPSAVWSPATFQGGTAGDTARYWTATVTPPSEGLYRLYTRATDRLGNQEPPAPQLASDLYEGSLYADGTPPVVAWTSPATTPSSTSAVAVELVAAASDYVDSGRGSHFSVASVWFEVDGVVWPADWIGTTVPTSGPRAFRAVVPLPTGPHTVKAVAVDRAGNRGEQTISLTGSASGEVATITSIKSGGATNQPVLTVLGYALFASAGPNHSVSVTVDSLPAVQAALDNPTAQFTGWSVTVNLPNPTVNADHTISAAASSVIISKVEATRDLGSSVTIRLDRTAPTATITSPGANPISTTVVLQGTAADTGGGGLDRVEVSVDGGATWTVAGLALTAGNPNSGIWSLSWTPPGDQNGATFPVQVRAVDKAGNSTSPVATLALKVDNVAPPSIAPTFNPVEGTHFGAPGSVQVTWTPPLDGSGPPDTLMTVDKLPGSEPGTVVTSPTSASFTSGGQWYIHLTARDAAGNRTTSHYGPWYVDSSDSGLCLDNRTVQVDGVLDLAAQEWRANREALDDDERPATRQTLYATWDAAALYLGWRGASWNLDGAMWAYASTGGAGTTSLVTPLPGVSLPFAANVAVQVTGSASATLYTWSGGAWTAQGSPTFGNVGQDTEVRVPWSLTPGATARLLAYAVTDAGAPWSVFPTTNALTGPWSSAYQWSNACAVTSPQAGQPITRSVKLTLSSAQSSLAPQGPNGLLQYTLAVQNQELSALTGLQARLDATTGLTYQSVDGNPVSPTASLILNLPSLAAGATRQVQITGRLAASLTGLDSVTTTAQVQLPSLTSAPLLAQTSLSHRVDSRPPSVIASSQVLAVGSNTLTGGASDGNGVGVKQVQFRKAGAATWTAATGTNPWLAPLTTSAADGTSVTIEFQATDLFDQVGAVQPVQFVLDSVPPTLSFSLPAQVGGSQTEVVGTAGDPFPASGRVVKVEVQIDDTASPWLEASGPFEPVGGAQGWHFTWNLPNVNGETHSLRARATDAAGNVFVSPFQSTIVQASAADLSVNVQSTPSVPVPGGPITYVITVDNTSTNDVTGVTVTDVFPTSLLGITWTCTATPYSSCGGDNGTGAINTAGASIVAAGGRLTFTVNATIDATARATLSHTASVALPSGVQDFAPNNNSALSAVSLQPRTDLALSITDQPDPVVAGTPVTYTLMVTNGGPSTATGVVVTDTLPAGVTLVSAPGCSGTTALTCALGTLPPQGTASLSVRVMVDPARRGSLTNLAGVQGTETDPTPGNNTASQTTTVIARPDLAVSQTFNPQPVVKFSPLTMILVVTNNGPSLATGVRLTDTLPSAIQFMSATASQGSCTGSSAGQPLTCDLGNLAVGASATVNLATSPVLEGSYNNGVAVGAVELDPNPANNTTSGPVIIVLRPPTATPLPSTTPVVTMTPTPTPTVVVRPPVKPALFRQGTWFLRNTLSTGPADTYINYGMPGDIPLLCDWDGNGTRTLGVYRPATAAFYLRNSNTPGNSDIAITYGLPSDVPVCGDWDGDGVQTVGVFRPSNAALYLRNSNTNGPADLVFLYGIPGDTFVSGDWNGDGRDTVGIRRGLTWYLKNSNTDGPADLWFDFGLPTDLPLVGDWDGSGTDTPGVYRGGTWFLRNSNSSGAVDGFLLYGGDPNDKPLVWR